MKRHRILLAVLLAVAVVVSATGCGRKYVMDRPDMYLAPMPEKKAQTYTVATFALNPILDLAEGGDGRFAWTALMWDKAGQETKLLALSLTQFTGDKVMIVMIPKTLSELAGSRLAVLDHGSKRIYNNQSGEYRELKSLWRKIDVEKYKDFLPEITQAAPFIKEVAIGSREDRDLLALYKHFRVEDAKIARKYIYARYGTTLAAEQLDNLAKEDSIVRGFADWLGRDWKLFVMYPFMDIASTALIAGIAKVFTLPSIWGDRIDRPGYMEYKPDAEGTAKMVLRGLKEYVKEYGGKSAAKITDSASAKLPDSIKAAIKGTPCADAETYDGYNACALEYNKRVLEENAKK